MIRYLARLVAAIGLLAVGWTTLSSFAVEKAPNLEPQIVVKGVFSKRMDGYIRRIAPSPDGKTIALAIDSGVIEIREIPGGAILHQVQTGEKIGAIAWHPNGSRLVAASYDAKRGAR